MMLGLPGETWLRLVIWLVVGLVIYFSYGKAHSRVQHGLKPLPPE
jgi:APA family basic amino acid/polyamine antiporter